MAIEAGLLTRDEIVTSHKKMRENMSHANAATIGLTMYPPYPQGLFKNKSMGPYSYQNGGDWTWFGARMVRQLARNGYVEESYRELVPMLERVLKHRGFFEWWTPSNAPRGSGKFRGSAGVLIEAIHELRQWAKEQSEKQPAEQRAPAAVRQTTLRSASTENLAPLAAASGRGTEPRAAVDGVKQQDGTEVVWQIGRADNSASEFALAPAGYARFLEKDFGWEDQVFSHRPFENEESLALCLARAG